MIKSKTQYKDLIKAQEEINDYDYRKMMIDFETETRHKKILNGIRNKWRITSSKYSEKIKSVKVENKKADKKKLIDFRKRYKAKELSIKKQLELNCRKKFGKISSKTGRRKT